jgi:hypothetical protein
MSRRPGGRGPIGQSGTARGKNLDGGFKADNGLKEGREFRVGPPAAHCKTPGAGPRAFP